MSDNETKPDETKVDEVAPDEAPVDVPPVPGTTEAAAVDAEEAATAEPEAAPEEAVDVPPVPGTTDEADAAADDEAVEAATEEAAEETVEAAAEETVEEEEEPEPERRFTVEQLERLLSFLHNKKRLQDNFYEDTEIVDIDWEKERILTRRSRPRPLPPSDEYMSFDFLVNFYAYHHGDIDKFLVDFR